MLKMSSVIHALSKSTAIVGLAAVFVASASVFAGSSIRLSPDLADGQEVRYFRSSEDGSHVAFITRGGGIDPAIYNCAIDGSSAIPIADQVPDLASLHGFSHNGQYLLVSTYYFDQGNRGDIYSVPTSGGTPVMINGPYPLRIDEGSPQINADDSRVIFMSPPDADNMQIYSAPFLGGQPPAPISDPVGPGTEVDHTSPILYSSSTDRVIFNNRETSSYLYVGTYSRAADGSGEQIKLHPETIISNNFNPMVLTPDGLQVIFEGQPAGIGGQHLYLAPVDGGTDPTQLTDRSYGSYHGIEVTQDGSKVVFIANSELYSVPIDAATIPVQLTASLGSSIRFTSEAFVAPTGDNVVFRAYSDSDLIYELYSVPVTGGTAVKLSDLNASNTGVKKESTLISPDGSLVLFRADNSNQDLYSVSILGGQAIQLGTMGGGKIGDKVLFTADGKWVIYKQNVGGERLWTVPVEGGEPIPLTDVGEIDDFDLTPDGMHLLYVGTNSTTQEYGLFALPIPEPSTLLISTAFMSMLMSRRK